MGDDHGEDNDSHHAPLRSLLDSQSPLLDPREDSVYSTHVHEEVNKPHLTAFHGFALVIGGQIGSGIFASPSAVDNTVPSPGAALIVWALAGLLAWTGAASLTELATTIPLNGGLQEYLRYVYGDTVAFLQSWIWIAAVKTTSMAIISLVFSEYTIRAVAPKHFDSDWLEKCLALLALISVGFINCISVKASSRFKGYFVYIKLCAVGLVIILGLYVAVATLANPGSRPHQDWRTKNWFATRNTKTKDGMIDWKNVSTWDMLGYYMASIYAGLWSYAGWDGVCHVAGEFKNPSRDIPLSIHTAMTVVIFCFELVNIAYYVILPWNLVSTGDSIAIAVGYQILGKAGAVIFAVLVGASCLGSLDVMTYTSSGMTVAAARRGYLPKIFAEIGIGKSKSHDNIPAHRPVPLWQTPIKAILFDIVVTSIYIVTGSFRNLITLTGIAAYTFFFLIISGSLFLRFKEPTLNRPYKPIILIPIIFCILSFCLVIRGVLFAPIQGMILGVLLIVGSFIYSLKGRFTAFSARHPEISSSSLLHAE